MSAAPAGPAGRPFAAHFVESVFLTWAGNLLRLVVGLVALRMVTSSIPEAALGAYWILTSVSLLLALFADLGLGLAAARHLPLASDPRDARRTMHTLWILRMAILGVLTLAIAALRPLILRVFDAEAIAEHYAFLYAFVWVNSITELFTNFLQGLNRFRVIAVLGLLGSVARLALIAALVLGMNLGVRGLFAAEVVAMALVALVSAAACGAWGLPRLHRPTARLHLGFGFPLYLNVLLSFGANRLNTLILGSYSGPVAVSWFTVAARLPEQLWIILRAFNQVYLPNMSHLLRDANRRRAEQLLASSLRLLSFGFALLALAFTFFRHEILAVLAPPSYQPAAAAVPLLAGSLVFAAMGSVLGMTLVALGDSRTPVKINFWTTLVSLALNFVLIPRYGVLGAAWATFAFNLVAWGVTQWVVGRRFPAGRAADRVLWLMLALPLYLGWDAPIVVRIVLLAASAAAGVLASPALRDDARRILRARRGAGPAPAPPPADPPRRPPPGAML